MHRSTPKRRVRAVLALACIMSSFSVTGVFALEEGKGEKQQLEACENDLCLILTKREGTGNDLRCSLQKTWAGTKIKQGIESKKLSWSLGDLRCSVQVEAKREDMINALGKPEFNLQLASHAVRCEVEREKEVVPVSVTLTPRIEFKNGNAVKAWLGIGDIQAPAVMKGAIWTAAQLQDTFGLFHGDLIREINKFVHERCPKTAGK